VANAGAHQTIIGLWKCQPIEGIDGAGEIAWAVSQSEDEELRAEIGQLVVGEVLANSFGQCA
jgi:hypothetical protein